MQDESSIMKIMAQIKTYLICLLLSLSSTNMVLCQIPTCCQKDSVETSKNNEGMDCHNSNDSSELKESSEESSSNAKFWKNKSTICHCKPYSLHLIGSPDFVASSLTIQFQSLYTFSTAGFSKFNQNFEVFLFPVDPPPRQTS